MELITEAFSDIFGLKERMMSSNVIAAREFIPDEIVLKKKNKYNAITFVTLVYQLSLLLSKETL